MVGLIGKKLGMTQIFGEEGRVIPVTVIKAGPCVVVQKKTEEKDGYSAVQLGFEEIKEKNVTKPLLGHFKKHGVKPQRILREFRWENLDEVKEGDVIKVDILEGYKYVDVEGISKGKGFQGVVKRWGFGGGPASHGTKQWHRRPGAIGAHSWPGRVWKGKKMPGRTGGERVTVKNLEIVEIRKDSNLLLVKGAVPGHNGSYVIIKNPKK